MPIVPVRGTSPETGRCQSCPVLVTEPGPPNRGGTATTTSKMNDSRASSRPEPCRPPLHVERVDDHHGGVTLATNGLRLGLAVQTRGRACTPSGNVTHRRSVPVRHGRPRSRLRPGYECATVNATDRVAAADDEGPDGRPGDPSRRCITAPRFGGIHQPHPNRRVQPVRRRATCSGRCAVPGPRPTGGQQYWSGDPSPDVANCLHQRHKSRNRDPGTAPPPPTVRTPVLPEHPFPGDPTLGTPTPTGDASRGRPVPVGRRREGGPPPV